MERSQVCLSPWRASRFPVAPLTRHVSGARGARAAEAPAWPGPGHHGCPGVKQGLEERVISHSLPSFHVPSSSVILPLRLKKDMLCQTPSPWRSLSTHAYLCVVLCSLLHVWMCVTSTSVRIRDSSSPGSLVIFCEHLHLFLPSPLPLAPDSSRHVLLFLSAVLSGHEYCARGVIVCVVETGSRSLGRRVWCALPRVAAGHSGSCVHSDEFAALSCCCFRSGSWLMARLPQLVSFLAHNRA